jgi:hypothetical protein
MLSSDGVCVHERTSISCADFGDLALTCLARRAISASEAGVVFAAFPVVVKETQATSWTTLKLF